MTVIIVTQRCSTIKNADLILVLDDGRLVGKGQHNELFENCETYREICLSQLNEEEAKDEKFSKKILLCKKGTQKIKPYSFYLILALVSAIISVSLTLYIPVLTGNAIDNIIDKGNVDFASVIQILVYIGVGIGGVALFQWIMTYFTNIVSYRTVRDLRREVLKNSTQFPLLH